MKNLSFLFTDAEGKTSCYLSELLPYDPGIRVGRRLEAGLTEYLMLLNAAEETIKFLHAGDLKQFDPLIGENSCQIRAIKLALTIRHSFFDTKKTLKSIRHARAMIQHALECLEQNKKDGVSLKGILENNCSDLLLSPSELYLVKAHILTKTKVFKSKENSKPLVMNERTDPKKIKLFGLVSSSYAHVFVSNLRKKAAANSVQFVQNLSKNQSQKCSTNKMVSDEYLIEHNGLSCVPCYWSIKIALSQALLHGIPIVLKAEKIAKNLDYKPIDETSIYFKPTAVGYKPVQQANLDPELPAIILYGSTCRELEFLPDQANWIKELIRFCPIEIALACASTHRQYPNVEKDAIFTDIDDDQYHIHRNKAQEWGCTLENPSLFFLSHVYCDKIKNL